MIFLLAVLGIVLALVGCGWLLSRVAVGMAAALDGRDVVEDDGDYDEAA